MAITLESIKKNEKTETLFPEWTSSETKKKLYATTMQMFHDIKVRIEQGEFDSARDIKLIARRIATSCGLSPSIITARRQPEIVALIETMNEDLSILYTSSEATRRHKSFRPTKDQLQIENRRLKEEIASLQNLALGSYASTVLHSVFPSNARNAAITIAKLKEEIERQSLIIENQAEQNRKYMEALSKYNIDD